MRQQGTVNYFSNGIGISKSQSSNGVISSVISLQFLRKLEEDLTFIVLNYRGKSEISDSGLVLIIRVK